MKGKSKQFVTAKANRGWWKPGAGQSVEWFLEKHRKITWVRVAVAVCPTLSGQGIEKGNSFWTDESCTVSPYL